MVDEALFKLKFLQLKVAQALFKIKFLQYKLVLDC